MLYRYVGGWQTRGSFTVRKSRAGESFYLRVYGKLNHNIRCTLRGYRNLMGDFTGNTIYTGLVPLSPNPLMVAADCMS